jgi:hypothetical protein
MKVYYAAYATLFWLTIIAGIGYGWGLNLMAVAHAAQAGSGVDAMFVLRCIGIFIPPLGALLGYVT